MSHEKIYVSFFSNIYVLLNIKLKKRAKSEAIEI